MIHTIFRYFAGFVILGVAGLAAFHFFVTKPIQDMLPIDKLAKALSTVTNAEVKTDGYTLTLDSMETRELVVVKRRVQTVVKYESSLLGSKKIFIVKGNFQVKAGFNLTEFGGFELKGNEAVGEWPAARVLGVELLDYETFFTSSGMVNRITERDREYVVNRLQAQARLDAIQNSDILEEAERIIRTRLEDLTDGEVQFPKKTP